MVECAEALKCFTPEMCGEGKLRGGGLNFRKRRQEVMDRVADYGAVMSGEQRNDWAWFKDAWDTNQADEHTRIWGGKFCQIVQALLEAMRERPDAVSNFMYSEIHWVLKEVRCLRL